MKNRKEDTKLKYKILVKYTSVLNKDFYEFYKITSENSEEEVEFETLDIDELNKTIELLDKKVGHENIRVVVDMTYSVNIVVDKDSMYQPVSSEDVTDMYAGAYEQVFGNGGE